MLTWPQVLYLGSRVADHGDPLLSIWRLSWIAHALPDAAERLPDANIFYPHPRSLAFSDATLLQGILALPWLRAHGNPVLAYNVLLITGIVTSGLGMFLLARSLTGDDDAALVSAAIFTLAPYRVGHIMHLELQWTVWMPLALWAVHRAFDTGRFRFGAAAGAFLGLQALSCLYYGAFLGLIVAVLAACLSIAYPQRIKAAAVPLCAGAALALAVTAVYARPYIENTRLLGVRSPGEIAMFSAKLTSYLTAPQENWLWGWTAFRFTGDELRLFPGVVAVVLGCLAFINGGRRRLAAIYGTILAVSVLLSLGFNAPVYRWLYEHVWQVRGFRAPARFGILASCALAVLAGFGFEYLAARSPAARHRPWLLVTVLAAIGLECGSAPMRLTEIPRQLPGIYRYLQTVQRTVVIELPMGLAPTYMYWSTHHWHRLVNGYSGYSPPDYTETERCMATFPDDQSIARLRTLHVQYVVLHEAFYKPVERTPMLLRLAHRSDIRPVGRFQDWEGTAQVFELR